MKGSGKPHLNDIARDVRCLLAEKSVTLTTEYIPGPTNRADRLSRTTSDKNDYAVRKSILEKVWSAMGVRPVVDMFAADHNAVLPVFWSWNRSPLAAAHDAMAQNWAAHNQSWMHCNPPWPLIPAVLKKLRRDGGRVIAVLPMWKGMPWWGSVRKMQVGEMFVLTGKIFQDKWGRLMPPPRWETVMLMLDGRKSHPAH